MPLDVVGEHAQEDMSANAISQAMVDGTHFEVDRFQRTKGSAQRLSYSSWRRHQTPVSLRPLGARSSQWYMPQRPSRPRA